jgi:DNA-binding NarL/FixJ family response regulator
LKTATFGWLALLVAAVALGGMAGTKKLTDAENSVGETARAAGGTALDPEVVAQLLARRAGGPLDVLSPRELEVLGLMAEGRSNSAVASQLVLTVGAVEKHVANTSRSCDCRRRRRITVARLPCSRTCSRNT